MPRRFKSSPCERNHPSVFSFVDGQPERGKHQLDALEHSRDEKIGLDIGFQADFSLRVFKLFLKWVEECVFVRNFERCLAKQRLEIIGLFVSNRGPPL